VFEAKEMALMSKARLVLLSLVAVLSVGAMVASSASAVTFQWKVGGNILKAGEQKTFTTSTDGTSLLKGTVGGAAAELLSTKSKVQAGAVLLGGQPGLNDELVEFESVKVDRPANCEAHSPGASTGVVATSQLTSEIVEAAPSGTGNGEPLILFKPASTTNETFTTIEFLGASCLVKGTKAVVSGLLVALPLPQGAEVKLGALDYEAITKEYKVLSGGAAKSAGLTFAGSAATFTGLALIELTSKEAFGAF
jgi:hypothetical protein